MKKFIFILLVTIGQCTMQASQVSDDYLQAFNESLKKMNKDLEQKIVEPKSSIINASMLACRLIGFYGILNSIWNEKITFSKMDVFSALVPFYFMQFGNEKVQKIGLCMAAVNIARIIRNKINAYKAKEDKESEENISITTAA